MIQVLAAKPGVVALVRSGPLSVTPAVGRYVAALREMAFCGTLIGLELAFLPDKPPPARLDYTISLKLPFTTLARRLLALSLWQAFLVWHLLRIRPAVIQYCDVFAAIPCVVVSRLCGSRLIFDVRDSAGLALSHWGVWGRIAGRIEDWALVRSDAVVVVSEALRRILPGGAKDHAHVVPNAPDRDLGPGSDVAARGGLTVNLSGFVSHRRNLVAWLSVASAEPLVRLDIFGSVADRGTQELLEARGLTVCSCSHEASLERMRGADIVSLMYDPSIAINCYAAPNKYYEALMLGKPIICSEGMKMEEELADWQCGLGVRYGDASSLARALSYLAEPHHLQEMSRNARRLYEARYAASPRAEMEALYRSVPEVGRRCEHGMDACV